MIRCEPVVLTDGDIRLEPLRAEHAASLAAAAADGELWNLHFTSVPAMRGVPLGRCDKSSSTGGKAWGWVLPRTPT